MTRFPAPRIIPVAALALAAARCRTSTTSSRPEPLARSKRDRNQRRRPDRRQRLRHRHQPNPCPAADPKLTTPVTMRVDPQAAPRMADPRALAGEAWRAGYIAAASSRGGIKAVGCRIRLCRI